MNALEEDLVRIEAWRALGMAGASPLLKNIREAAGQLIRSSEEDEHVQNYALQTLALRQHGNFNLYRDVINNELQR
ncbi:hypothetical protein HUB98_21640 [Paenibacillus barcinonensis]|uniref:HEAT repeat protein n=1 Tax=Paenibacillus barcinonensis TaxID=198119 RepID=A0ABX6QAF0_PAEBA|nr:hypothetical protein [Paenibacillus barcinonensis]QKS58575.1 hypothetical protein HUB98_21640 [Paenibacillus barcinonensis]